MGDGEWGLGGGARMRLPYINYLTCPGKSIVAFLHSVLAQKIATRRAEGLK